MPLSVKLGPGLCGEIFDGIQRSLDSIKNQSKSLHIHNLGEYLPYEKSNKLWEFKPACELGQFLRSGDVYGTVVENRLLCLKLLVPHPLEGLVVSILTEGFYPADNTILQLKDGNGIVKGLSMIQEWPIRTVRKYNRKIPPAVPLFTGLRVLDALFPCFLGGTAAIPGAFGCGKTSISHAISMFSNADIVIYIGCGERGNEMAELLTNFPYMNVHINGKNFDIMERTIIIANTSDMPVAAREASIFTGITIAEYFRDQGLNVALIADSTSRWAEALREMSGRLEEIPAEGGYPAYLSSRLFSFYARAGRFECLGSHINFGSITIIASISPPAGDFSDPVTTITLGIVDVFWGLDKKLSQKKIFPSINLEISFSNFIILSEACYSNIDPHFIKSKSCILNIIDMDRSIQEVVKLIGKQALSEPEKLVFDFSRILRRDFLQQNFYSDYDKHCNICKSIRMMKHFSNLYLKSKHLLESTCLSWSELSKILKQDIFNLSLLKYKDNSENC